MSNVESALGWNYFHDGSKGWVEAEWAGNMQEAIERVRELVEKYETFATELDPRFAPAAVFSGVAKELRKALDGEQE